MPQIDFNLLAVFDVLIEARSVTRAAERLGVTQSAVSHALARLRDLFGDPLFVRVGGALQPTPRALEAAPEVREGLARVRAALSQTAFDAATTTREFVIQAGPYFSMTVLPEVVVALRSAAPLAVIRAVHVGPGVVAALDDGTLDLALGAFGRTPSHMVKEVLFSEQLVWIAAAGKGPVNLQRRQRLIVTVGLRGADAETISAGGLERRIALDGGERERGEGGVFVHDSLAAVAIVARSDLVALAPRRVAMRAAARGDIRILEAEDVEPVEISMLWPARLNSDSAHTWFRIAVGEAIRRASGA